MKKLILSFFFVLLSVFFVIATPTLAEVDLSERWTDGNFEYEVRREGNSISLTSTNPKIPRAAGIPTLVGAITGTTFTGKQYLVADECPNLDAYVPASGTVLADGSVTVKYTNSQYYYRTCVEKPGSQFEDSSTYTIASVVSKSPTQPSSDDCWRKHMQITGCLPKFAECINKCPKRTGDPAAQACANACSKVSDECSDAALANYRACEAAKKTQEQKPQDNQISFLEELEQVLGQVEKTQMVIDQCSPPRVPSEGTCVSNALLQFELPTYLKDVTIEPDFTNTIVLDKSKEIQIVSFPEGIKEVSDYMRNTMSTNLDYLKEEIMVDKSQLPIINLSPAYPTKVHIPEQSYSIVKSDGLSSVITPSKIESDRFGYYGSWQSLVALDKDVDNAVVVGGPAVFNATKIVLDSNAKLTLRDNSNQSVMEVSNGAKIYVAGTAADDTIEAAMDFISQLKNLDDE